MDVLYLFMLHNDGNIVKKFQPSIFYRGQEIHVSDNLLVGTSLPEARNNTDTLCHVDRSRQSLIH